MTRLGTCSVHSALHHPLCWVAGLERNLCREGSNIIALVQEINRLTLQTLDGMWMTLKPRCLG